MASSLPSRVMQVFVSPGRLFDELREEPRSFWILVLSGLVVMATMVLIPADAWMTMARERMANAASGGAQTPMTPERMAVIMRWSGVVGGGVFWAVWALALSGLSTLIFAGMLGDEGRFKQYLSVVSHAMVIMAVGAVVSLPLKILQNDVQLSLSLGTFAFFMNEGYPLRVLQRMDLFSIWGTVVIALGVSRIDRNRSWGSAAAVLLVLLVGVSLLIAIPGG